jgi:gliding motility-associated lipoprotein GldD
VYGKIIPDTNFFGEKPENPYWINIDFPSLGGRIYVSYKIIGPNQTLDKLIEDTYEMTAFHTKKADYIADMVFDTLNVHGIFYNVTGNAASAYQFYATDSVKHFLRGALYFDVTPNADSLKPVNEFLKTDMEHMIGTLRWRN